MSAARVAAGLVLLLAEAAPAANVEDERAAVKERLDAEHGALDALEGQRAELLTLLSSMEALAERSTQAVRALEAELELLSRRTSQAEALDGLVRRALEDKQAHLGPRLRGLYRLRRQGQLAVLLSAKDFAGLVRRARAMRSLVDRDVALLAEAQAAARFQRSTARLLEGLRASAKAKLEAIRREEALARERRERFHRLLVSVQAEALRAERVLGQLGEAERQLGLMAEQLASEVGSGFRALRGRMPYPTRGMVEVGFGKVLNPRFNTVTLRKGLDLRAAAGTPVVSVAEGTVVYVGWLKGYGNLVILDHGGGYHSLMAHLARADVEVGNEVEQGEEIGAVGDTDSSKGAYLYFELRFRGRAIDPVPWLSAEE